MAKQQRSNLQADIVIVGGGGSGLTAAVSAIENGAKSIIILEKREKLGGNAVFPDGLFAVDSYLQKRLGMDAHADEVFNYAMSYAHWRTNSRLVRTLIDRSADTLRWLQKKGIDFTTIITHYPNQQFNTYHSASGPGTTGSLIIKALTEEIEKSSKARIFTGTPAKKLIVKNGRIAGVIAQDKDGNELRITTGVVIIGTGGFVGNEALIKKYDPTFSKEQVPPLGLAHNGDGILMASEIGAALDGMVVYEWEEHFRGAPILTTFSRRPSTLWVNRKGERFIDENTIVLPEAANAINRQPGREIYSLFDEKIKRQNLDEELTPVEPLNLNIRLDKKAQASFKYRAEETLNDEVSRGNVMISKSWNEIARWIGAKPEVLKDTIAEYNSFCAKGHDELFTKDRRVLIPLDKPPYYALKCGLKLTATHGGIKINHRMEALDTQDEPIPGLYAVGIETGATDWDTYNMPLSGHSFGFTINSGRIAGEEAVKYIKQ